MTANLHAKLFIVFSFLLGVNLLQAQDTCTYSCQDHVYLSLDENCQYTVSLPDVMTDTSGCSGATLELFDHYSNKLPLTLNGDHRGIQITFKVVGTSGNSCWGYITVEDKWATIIECVDDTLHCWDAEEFINATPEGDNCGYDLQFEEIHRTWVDYGCDSADFVGYIQRSVVSTDVWGNTSRCDSQRIYIVREYLDSVICPEEIVEIECCTPGPDPVTGISNILWNPEYVYEDEDGYSHPIPKEGGLVEPPYIDYPTGRHYLGGSVNSEGQINNGKCNIIAEYKDHIIPTCGTSYKIRREWKLFDWCTGEDTVCVQWIKIVDNQAPVIFFSEEFTPVIVAYTKPHECLAHVELGWPTVYNDCAIASAKTPEDLAAAFASFKVTYEMEWVDPDHPGNVEVRTGVIPYGEKVIEYVPKTGLLFVQPDIKVKYTVTDGCWNSSRVCQTLLVYDITPPTPVCDELTQVTLDPDSCWVRIYAEDLDDGSNDNCDDVHFAVATMSEIEYWREYWHTELHECYLLYHEYGYVLDAMIEEWIDLYVFDSYIDLDECGRDSLVLRVYEDLGTPPYDPHVFRGTEHDWYNWFRAPLLRFSSYRCNYVFYYDSLGKYNDPIRPEISCDEIQFAIFREILENGIVDFLDALNRFDFEEIAEILNIDATLDINEFFEFLFSLTCTNFFVDDDPNDEDDNFLEYITCFDLGELIGSSGVNDFFTDDLDITEQQIVDFILLILNETEVITPIELGGFGPGFDFDDDDISIMLAPIESASSMATADANLLNVLNVLYYLICYGDDIEMKRQVFKNLATYPELLSFVSQERNLVSMAYSGVWRKRFLDIPYYNDCMIEVIKDDKTPPVCVAPADASFYCDGVPVVGSFFPNGGNDKVSWTSARFAHDICSDSDFWQAGCEFDRTDDGADSYGTPGQWCVHAPWDGGDHGYYGGPSHDDYHYDPDSYRDCDEALLAWYPEDNGPDSYRDWKPIYCRFWLMLDKYDAIEGEGKPNPYDYFGEPEYYDNCWYPEISEETVGELDECGVGILTRTWTVTDKCGNTSSCYQTIVIKPRSDFEVKFPADVEVQCDAVEDLTPIEDDPSSYPIVTDDDCELIGITYSDQVIDIEQDGCYKILRTWKVIDWCVYSPDLHNRYPDVIVNDTCVAGPDRPCIIRNLKDDGDGFMTYLQVLKIVDSVAPEVVCNPDSVFCIYDENCDDLLVEYDLGSATDSCTENLQYRYAVNPNGDSDDPDSYREDWIYGHGSRLQNVLPVGVHTVRLYAKDDCGNEGYCDLVVEVRDCKPPTPYCYDGIATVVMPTTEEIAVWARDLDAGSFDNCTEDENLRFTFTSTPPEEDSTYVAEDRSSYNVYTCDDLGQVQVEIYVWDEAGNVDFCTVALLIQPGSEACPGQQLTNGDDKKQAELVKTGNPDSYRDQIGNNAVFNGIKSNVQDGGAILLQNRPNPFRNETLIGFELPNTRANQIGYHGYEWTRIEIL